MILGLCKLGDYIERKLFPGAKLLKREVNRLQSSIIFLYGSLDRPPANFDLKSIIGACKNVRSTIQSGQITLIEVQNEVKKFEKKQSKHEK